jgi:glycosyltransferase involved in cell wall biosynthesis
MARPVISTTLGAEGLTVTDNEHILIADSPQQFVDAIVAVANSPLVARRLAETGRQLALAEYDWRQILRGLEDLYQTVLAGDPP